MPDDLSLDAPTAMPSLLLVDDDVELCAMVGEFLETRGFRVTYAHDGPSGLGRAISAAYELVVLDVMLPLLDGFEVLRQIRRRSMVPVIMLTARADEHDRIAGLENGADDYLIKPFAARELLARIHAVSRRARHTIAGAPNEVEAGPVRLNRQTGDAWCDGKRLELTATEFTILDLLARSAGRVVTRDAISAVLYQRQATPYERSVDVHMSHLRRKLEPELGLAIRTVRGVGYTLVVTG